MSIYPLLLPGWDQCSTWGAEAELAMGVEYFYAQLTRNGHSDDDGPEFWISPPQHPAYCNVVQLAAAVSRITATDTMTVLRAMSAVVDPQTRRALLLPEPAPRSELLLVAELEPQPPRRQDAPQPLAADPVAGARTAGRAYLDVPYGDKDAAKVAGARWDPAERRWYDPHPPTSALQRWAARPEIPEVLPGEDRSCGSGLFVDVVPSSCWFTNVRSCVSQQDWERLRRPILRRAGHRCEICGAREDRARQQWLDVHERWHYDEPTAVQTLRRLLAVCKPCHLATHYGFARISGREDEALAHLIAVTGRPQAQIAQHIDHAFAVWERRSRRVWELDLSMLTGVGVTVHPPEPAVDRPAAAARALNREGPRRPNPIPSQRSPVAPPAPAGQLASPPAPRTAHTPPRRGLWARILGKA